MTTDTEPRGRRRTEVWRWWLALAVTAVVSGVVGGAMALLLDALEEVFFDFHGIGFAAGYARAGRWRQVLVPSLGAAVAGAGWWWVRRRRVTAIEAMAEPTFSPGAAVRVTVDALLQILVVGAGASIGREGAPRQTAAAFSALTTRRLGLDDHHRRVLVAAAAGAGLAAVYTSPVGGAMFALEIVLSRTRRRPGDVVSALVVSGLAVLTARPFTHDALTYHWPGAHVGPAALPWFLLVVPMCLVCGVAFERLITVMRRGRAGDGPGLVGWLALAGLAFGVVASLLPQLPGNGKVLMGYALSGAGGAGVMVALALAKALTTGMYLRAGATGGLLTPSLSTGASLGAALGIGVQAAGLGTSGAAWVVVTAAGFLAVTQRAPLFAAFFTYELVAPPLAYLPVLLVVALLCHGLATNRRVERLRVIRSS